MASMSRGRLASRKRSCLGIGGFLLSNLYVLMALLRICEDFLKYDIRKTHDSTTLNQIPDAKHHEAPLKCPFKTTRNHPLFIVQAPGGACSKKSILAHTCSHSHFWHCVSAFIYHLPTFSYHSRLWVSRRGHSNGETCGYNRPAGILIQKVQHLICATCSHVSIYIIYINMYANPMLIFALFHFMIKYVNFNTVLEL